MDALMLGVTGVALALAVGMSIVAVRLLRGERHRSAARVAALEAAALDLDDGEDLAYRDEPADDEAAAVSGPMFVATEEPKAPGRRWLALAAVAIVMAALVGTMYAVFKPATVDASSGSAASTPHAAQSGAVSTAASGHPIELLSLKHTIDNNAFSVVGLVVNPLDAAPLTHVIAVVYLFDKDGAYFASGKSELEFSGLRPGEESPFKISIPNVEHVGKYRVGFRREDGSVIAHVDKRGQKAAGSMSEGGQ